MKKKLIIFLVIILLLAAGIGVLFTQYDISFTKKADSAEQTGDEVTEEEAEQDVLDDSEVYVKDQESKEDLGKTPVEAHGTLSVEGTQLVDANGKAFQIKGVSTHGLMWYPEYVNKDTFMTLRDQWNVNCIRLAMYTGEGGYCTGGDKEELKSLVENGVDYATELGMYVIVDWHVLQDKDPNTFKEEAKLFFDEISKKYANSNNVIYEICNEPNGTIEWKDVKAYAEEIIPVIRANDNNAIIVVGTPNWSQDVDKAAKSPIEGYDNIMYAVHFYAETHRAELRKKVSSALADGLPVFCSEFGICDASGNGRINESEADKWIAYLNENGISYNIWNLSNKSESSSLLLPTCTSLSNWGEDDLSQEGKWYVKTLGGKLGQNATASQEKDDDKDKVIEEKESDDSSESKADDSTAQDSKQDEKEAAKDEENDSKTDTDKTQKSGKIEVSAKCDNSWEDGGKTCKQLNITLENKGDAVTEWKVTYELDGKYEIVQGWNGNFEISGKKLTITNVDYNGNIDKNQKLSDIGVIVKEK